MTTFDNYPGTRHEPSFAEDIKTIATAFLSRWRLIVVMTGLFLVLGVGYVWTSAPVYTSSVELFIDPRGRSVLENEVAPTGLGSTSQGADSALVESQLAILRSRSVLTRLAETEGLFGNPLLDTEGGSGPVAMVKGLIKLVVYGPNAGSYGGLSPEESVLQSLSRAIRVERVGLTYVLRLTVRTQDPILSARLANSLADIYQSETQNAVDASVLETAESLEGRLTELRAASDAAQREVETYRRDNGLISAQGILVDEQELADLTARVTDAVVATQQARTALEDIRQGGMNSQVYLTSENVRQMRDQLAQAQSDETVLASTLGARHPRLIQARETREALEVSMRSELGRVIARAEGDVQAAETTEASLKRILAQYQDRRAGSDVASVRLRELEQIAAQNLEIYNSYALRAKQAREQVALPTAMARIISVAQPQAQPSEPRVPLILAGSALAGLVAGSALAWLLHLLVGPPAPRSSGRRMAIPNPVSAITRPFGKARLDMAGQVARPAAERAPVQPAPVAAPAAAMSFKDIRPAGARPLGVPPRSRRSQSNWNAPNPSARLAGRDEQPTTRV